MRFLITAGPTREPIDPVRYIGNRSSGKMGAALAQAAREKGHAVTMIVGPITVEIPEKIGRIDIESSRQMEEAVLSSFPACDVLIMAAAVADYRPKTIHPKKLGRHHNLILELEPTVDIVAEAAKLKKPHQRVIGFSLEQAGDLNRAHEKLLRKKLDLIVFNPTETMNAESVDATLLYPDGKTETIPSRSKAAFADILIDRAVALVGK
jgi:phosphopantothenoylcysteine decarboxylase/phosphopantothenate--cysteine ligase